MNGVYTIGNGDIYAMCPVTTAISQGQFGQFPMLLFCSDGNYAMSVNSEGFYSTISPIQRDVCLNSRSITQMDSEVLFISSRGVMITNGASIDCISQALQGVFEPVPEEIGTNMEMIDKPPIELIKTAMIAYDYANQRIIFMLKDMDTSLCFLFLKTDGTRPCLDVLNLLSIYFHIRMCILKTGLSGSQIYMIIPPR